MDIEAIEAAETAAGSLACCGVLCDLTRASPARLQWLLKAFFLVADLTNLVLDFMFVRQLADMGERGMAALMGVMTCFGFCVWSISKCALSGNRRPPVRNVVYKILTTELLIYVLEDYTTLFVFTVTEGAYDPSVPSSVTNLWVTIVSGWAVMVSMWVCLLISRPPLGCCCVLPYLVLITYGLGYFTSFALLYLIPAKSIADVSNSTKHVIFTKLDSEMDPDDYLSLPTSTYIMTQTLGWINALMMLFSVCGDD